MEREHLIYVGSLCPVELQSFNVHIYYLRRYLFIEKNDKIREGVKL